MKPTQAQFSAYQQIVDYYNRTLFESSLPDCMLSFSRRRRSSHTLFTAGQWHAGEGSATPEISLNLQHLCEGEPIEVMATLVRQLVHLWQEMYGKPSRTGYYNREWAEKMTEIGLIPTATGLPGGRKTGQSIKHYIERDGRFAKVFREMPPAYLWPFRPASFSSQNAKGYSEKAMYHCTGCGTKVWGKGSLGLMCECGKVFADETGETKAGVEEKVYSILVARHG